MSADAKWKAVSAKEHCPICGRHSWCSRSGEVVRCMKPPAELPTGWETIKLCYDGGVVYRPTGGRDSSQRDFPALHRKFVAAATPERLQQLADELGVTAESLRAVECGWSNRVWTFPERDATGAVIGITTRDSSGTKKSMRGGKRGLTIPASPPPPGVVLIVEGPSDVAACLTMGLAAVGRPSAKSGGAMLAELLSGQDVLVVGENDLKPDGTHPGLEGAQTIARQLAAARKQPVSYAMPPEGVKDARAWLQSFEGTPQDAGKALLAHLQQHAVVVEPAAEPIEFRVERQGGRVKARVTAVRGEEVIAADALDLGSERARQRMAERVAAQSGEPVEAMEKELLRLAAEPEEPHHEPRGAPAADDLLAQYDDEVAGELDRMDPPTVGAAEALLADPKLINRILADIERIGVVGEQQLAISCFVIGVSRLLARPLAGIVQGTTSSGKSFVIERVSRMFPEESLLRATDLTPNALYHLAPGRLIHRWVVAGERSRREDDERAEATRAIREMLASGELRKATAQKVGNQFETVLIYQPGPIAFIESTTLAQVFEEDANRALLLATDESPPQTRRVLFEVARRAAGAGTDAGQIIAIHHAVQRLLQRCIVTIPFAERLAEAMPDDRPEARRAISHTMAVISALAILHQRQRAKGHVRHGDGITATLDDYVVARRLLEGPLGRALGGGLPEAVVRLGQRLGDHFGDRQFTTSDAVRAESVIKSRGRIGEYLRSLGDAGAVELVEAGKGNKPAVWRFVGEVPQGGARWLPTVDALTTVRSVQGSDIPESPDPSPPSPEQEEEEEAAACTN